MMHGTNFTDMMDAWYRLQITLVKLDLCDEVRDRRPIEFVFNVSTREEIAQILTRHINL